MVQRVLARPFRLAGDGSAATVPQWSPAQARQVAWAVVATRPGERPLAALFGVADPAGRGVGEEEVATAVELCEPDLAVVSVDLAGPEGSRQGVRLAVAWRDDDDPEVPV